MTLRIFFSHVFVEQQIYNVLTQLCNSKRGWRGWERDKKRVSSTQSASNTKRLNKSPLDVFVATLSG